MLKKICFDHVCFLLTHFVGLTNAGGLDNADEDVSFSDLEDDENDINQGKVLC